MYTVYVPLCGSVSHVIFHGNALFGWPELLCARILFVVDCDNITLKEKMRESVK